VEIHDARNAIGHRLGERRERRIAQRMDAWKPFSSNSILTSLESVNDLLQPARRSPNERA
jgi:hypothetical protein